MKNETTTLHQMKDCSLCKVLTKIQLKEKQNDSN